MYTGCKNLLHDALASGRMEETFETFPRLNEAERMEATDS
jgi:ABC-type branched-subunit amino acid transport system ATPase component